MSILAGRARRLELARGVGRQESRVPVALVWTSPDVEIDRSTLKAGELLVTDRVIVERGIDGAPWLAVSRDRITSDPEDYGRVLDSGGAEIGRVLRGVRGGALLECTARAATGAPAADAPG